MKDTSRSFPWIIGLSVFFGLTALGFLLGNAIIQFKKYDRTVTVKGLSEQEYPANLVSWHISCSDAHDNLAMLYKSIGEKTKRIYAFLESHDIKKSEIIISPPVVLDKLTSYYSQYDPQKTKRYTVTQNITVYSTRVDAIGKSMAEIGKFAAHEDIVVATHTSYSFTKLNEVKPHMIEEATKNARVSASKFAADSQSKLGKIKTASQGQFSILGRENSPHIKKVRVVSTIVYYLVD